MKLKIALADDEPLFRNGISFLLQREADIDVIFEASDGSQLLAFLKLADSLPDIIIIDLKMPELNGVEATRIVCEEYPKIKVIVLTSYNTKMFIRNMIDVGAASYLVKNTTPANLIKTIREVAAKGFYYDEHVVEVIKEDIAGAKNTKSAFESWQLTSREKEIIQLICSEYSTKEIADKLFISQRTVEGHRNNLLLKTECKNMAGLVIYALRNDILTIKDIMG